MRMQSELHRDLWAVTGRGHEGFLGRAYPLTSLSPAFPPPLPLSFPFFLPHPHRWTKSFPHP